MKNSSLPLLALLLALGVASWFLFGRGPDEPLDTSGNETVVAEQDPEDVEASEASASKSEPTTAKMRPARETIEVDGDDFDPFYRRSLAGFRGRLVFTSGKPGADKPVRFFRVDPEVLQNPSVFAAENLMQPLVELYDCRSDDEGLFSVSGVFPRVFYLMVADVDGENRKLQLVPRTPGAGEVIDLGDVELPDLGSISGRVVDDDGDAVADALVRAVDLPGTALDFAPVHRFDPEGGLFVTEGSFKVTLTMPKYAKTLFDLLPLPTTRTDSNGEFKLLAVQPGQNVLVVNKRELAPIVRKGVRVRPGKEKKVGKLRMREGEIAEGKVLDSSGQPIADAEILIANRNVAIPVHFASFAKNSATDGSFSMAGMSPGQVFAAVRRSPKEAWVLQGPMAIAGELVLRLPAQHSLTIRVKSERGLPLEDVNFKVVGMPSQNGPPGLDLATLGLAPWVDVGDRVERTRDGHYRIGGLNANDYTIAVKAKGHAPAKLEVKLIADAEEEVTLQAALTIDVLVVDSQKEPIRNAKIYAQNRGDNWMRRVQRIPILVGRTNREGKATIEECEKGSLRISASHPAYGMHHKQLQLPVTSLIVFTMLEPGVITGQLLDDGKAPKPGKWSITIEKHWRDERGAMPTMPRMVLPDLEGNFRINGVAPGTYRVNGIPSFAAIGSPGGVMKLATGAFRETGTEEVTVTSGNVSHVQLDASGKRKVTGPSARISGTVMINGRAGTGTVIQGWSQQGRIFAEVDATGRFDLGQVAVGTFNLQLQKTSDSQLAKVELIDGDLWSQHGKLEEGKDLRFDLTLDTGKLSGTVLLPNGQPATSVQVRAEGQIHAQLDKPKSISGARVTTITDRNGRFDFPTLVAGTYWVHIQGDQGYGRSEKLQVQAGLPVIGVRIDLEQVYTIKGVIDLSVYPQKPDYMYVWFSDDKTRRSRGAQVDSRTGKFEIRGLPKGSYTGAITYWSSSGDRQYRQGHTPEPIVVDGDRTGIKIRPTFEQPKPPKRGTKKK